MPTPQLVEEAALPTFWIVKAFVEQDGMCRHKLGKAWVLS